MPGLGGIIFEKVYVYVKMSMCHLRWKGMDAVRRGRENCWDCP